MKCSRCGRTITHVGGEVRMRDEVLLFGPKCAKLAGLMAMRKPPPQPKPVDAAQLPLGI